MSDQDDFFFDEDDAPAQKPVDKGVSKGGAARKDVPAPRAKSTAPAAVPAGGQSVTMTVAALIGVVALLVGIIIGILVPTGGTQSTTPATTMPAVDPGQARPLAPEELEGDLPPGHPDIGEMGGGTGATGTVDPGSPADGAESE